MELKGKTLFFLGDSITQRYNATTLDGVYHALIAAKYGCNAVNYGITATRIARQSDQTDNSDAFVDRCLTMEGDPDFIVIMGGTNDFGHGDAPLFGKDSLDPYSFYGACNLMIKRIKEKFPRAKIVVASPLRRQDMNVPNANGKILADYVEVLHRSASENGVAYIDLFGVCPINPDDPENRALYAWDGVHPGDAGHSVLAECLGEFLAKS